MTNEAFTALLEARITTMREVFAAKSAEYSTAGDVLSAFKSAAAFLHCTPRQALLGMLAKHLVSIVDLVQRDGPIERWEEKIGDSILYLTLLEAIKKESK